jgi:uncharacterized RDD family membrane protein YckC
MADEGWFFMTGTVREGPVSVDDLRARLQQGDLSRMTLVQNTAQGEWVPAEPLPGEDAVHPWLRLGARFVDVSLFSVGGGLLLGFAYPELFDGSYGPGISSLVGMGFLVAWIVVESMLLSSWGTTPGKLLLNVRLRNRNNDKPKFLSALNRSFLVWWRGLGIGFPIITLIAQLRAHRALTTNGVTTWDRDLGFRVRHDRVGPLRVLVTFTWIAIFAWLWVNGLKA